MEQYTYIESDKAQTKRCVYPWGDYEKFGAFTHCEGEGCMGWVQEMDAYGNPTGRGRCGMVHQMVSMPFSAYKDPWWKVNRVEE